MNRDGTRNRVSAGLWALAVVLSVWAFMPTRELRAGNTCCSNYQCGLFLEYPNCEYGEGTWCAWEPFPDLQVWKCFTYPCDAC